eukprot:5686459-Prorocentrum_lima.AAC.1
MGDRGGGPPCECRCSKVEEAGCGGTRGVRRRSRRGGGRADVELAEWLGWGGAERRGRHGIPWLS